MKELKFPLLLKESSWVAARILPSSHTNPIWVTVDGKPVRASRRSAEWCLRGVNDCWNQKKKFIGEDEMEDAENAYAHARSTYRRILAESLPPEKPIVAGRGLPKSLPPRRLGSGITLSLTPHLTFLPP